MQVLRLHCSHSRTWLGLLKALASSSASTVASPAHVAHVFSALLRLLHATGAAGPRSRRTNVQQLLRRTRISVAGLGSVQQRLQNAQGRSSRKAGCQRHCCCGCCSSSCRRALSRHAGPHLGIGALRSHQTGTGGNTCAGACCTAGRRFSRRCEAWCADAFLMRSADRRSFFGCPGAVGGPFVDSIRVGGSMMRALVTRCEGGVVCSLFISLFVVSPRYPQLSLRNFPAPPAAGDTQGGWLCAGCHQLGGGRHSSCWPPCLQRRRSSLSLSQSAVLSSPGKAHTSMCGFTAHTWPFLAQTAVN